MEASLGLFVLFGALDADAERDGADTGLVGPDVLVRPKAGPRIRRARRRWSYTPRAETGPLGRVQVDRRGDARDWRT